MDSALSSIVGKRRDQEDYGAIAALSSSGAVLAVIADGMGGQVAGEIASIKAVKGFIENFSSSNFKNLPLKLNMALGKANRLLAQSISNDPKLQGMGTTLVAAHVTTHDLRWISVGDSILYLYRDRRLCRLNIDHSMKPVLEASVSRGKISKDEALAHPNRNALLSALTGQEIPLVDLREEPYPLKKDDVVLLATDGISTLSDLEISIILDRCKDRTAKDTADSLLDAIVNRDRPRQDNTLIEVIKISIGGRTRRKWAYIVAVASAVLVPVITVFLVIWGGKQYLLKGVGLANTNQDSPKIVDSPTEKVTPIVLDVSSPTAATRAPSKSPVSEPALSSPAATRVAEPASSSSKSSASRPTGVKKIRESQLARDNPSAANQPESEGDSIRPPLTEPILPGNASNDTSSSGRESTKSQDLPKDGGGAAPSPSASPGSGNI